MTGRAGGEALPWPRVAAGIVAAVTVAGAAGAQGPARFECLDPSKRVVGRIVGGVEAARLAWRRAHRRQTCGWTLRGTGGRSS